jgi:hypothetical protein
MIDDLHGAKAADFDHRYSPASVASALFGIPRLVLPRVGRYLIADRRATEKRRRRVWTSDRAHQAVAK